MFLKNNEQITEKYMHVLLFLAEGLWDVCVPRENSSDPEVCRQGVSGHPSEERTQWLTLAASQVLFGISYVDVGKLLLQYCLNL